uniref:TLC domain-containing protein n=1 Tax=Scophthalmus maximus TaxID=52904 RepID=A0A8D3DGU0_SCOMX
MDLRSVLLVTGGSACSFKLLNTLFRFLPTPAPARKKAWKWRNISTSLAHSTLTGAWAVLWCVETQQHAVGPVVYSRVIVRSSLSHVVRLWLCSFSLRPQMVADLISSHSVLSHSLVAVSTGYFIHDFLDLASNQSVKQSWEVLLHHSVVISCFGLAVTSRLYLGFAVVSLLVEINSVFLHIRQLLLLSGQRNRPGGGVTAPRPTVTYTTNCWLNLGTFLVFRACTLGWMGRWLAGQTEHMPRHVLMMGRVGLSLISVMNVVLFYRLVRADILTDTNNTKGRH